MREEHYIRLRTRRLEFGFAQAATAGHRGDGRGSADCQAEESGVGRAGLVGAPFAPESVALTLEEMEPGPGLEDLGTARFEPSWSASLGTVEAIQSNCIVLHPPT